MKENWRRRGFLVSSAETNSSSSSFCGTFLSGYGLQKGREEKGKVERPNKPFPPLPLFFCLIVLLELTGQKHRTHKAPFSAPNFCFANKRPGSLKKMLPKFFSFQPKSPSFKFFYCSCSAKQKPIQKKPFRSGQLVARVLCVV